MQVGDLVKVSNNGFTAIGYIATILGKFHTIKYFAILEKNGYRETACGIWSEPHIQLLSSVKKCP